MKGVMQNGLDYRGCYDWHDDNHYIRRADNCDWPWAADYGAYGWYRPYPSHCVQVPVIAYLLSTKGHRECSSRFPFTLLKRGNYCMAINIKKRLLAVLLCLVLVVCVVVQPVFANPVAPVVVGVEAGYVALAVIAAVGIVCLSNQDAYRAVNSFLSEVQKNNEQRNAFYSSCAAYAQQGLQGLNASMTYENLEQYLDVLIGMGFTATGEHLTSNVPVSAIPYTTLVPSGSVVDPWAYFGSPFVWYSESGTGFVFGDVVSSSSSYFSVPIYYLSSYQVGNTTPAAWMSWSVDAYYTKAPYHVIDVKPVLSVLPSYGSPRFAIRYENTSTGEIGYVATGSGNGSIGPSGDPSKQKLIALGCVVAGGLLSVVYDSDISEVQQKLTAVPSNTPVNFVSVPSSIVGGKRYSDVITYPNNGDTSSTTSSDVTSSGVTSSGGTSSIPADSPLTIGGIQSLFLPAPDYLSKKFSTLLNKFPEQSDLSVLQPLTELGEKKPNFPLILNDYFGITTNQKGVDIDIWDDKRNWIHNIVKAVLIIFLVIFDYNMIVKLIRNSAFSDVGTPQSPPVAHGRRPPRGD